MPDECWHCQRGGYPNLEQGYQPFRHSRADYHMSGYALQPYFRQSPLDGVETVTDVRAAFRDVYPYGYLKVDFRYETEQDKGQDINRELRSEQFGLRLGATITFQIEDFADFPYIRDLVKRFLQSRNWTTYFSPDLGATEIEVEYVSYKQTPIKGRTTAGVLIELAFSSVPLLEEPLTLSDATAAPLTSFYARVLPPAGPQYRGQIWVREGGANDIDEAFMCLKNQSGPSDYDWQPVQSGV